MACLLCLLQLAAKRPVSPHVFEIDGKSMHYKMPVNAVSSIVNRATGVALSAGELLYQYVPQAQGAMSLIARMIIHTLYPGATTCDREASLSVL